MIAPPAVIFTVPLVTDIVCAVPGVNVVPLIEAIDKVPPSLSLSPVNGNKVTVPSSATV